MDGRLFLRAGSWEGLQVRSGVGGPRVQPLTPSLNGLRLNITSLYGLWVEAVEEPPGVPEAWHEGKGENDPARMQLLCALS